MYIVAFFIGFLFWKSCKFWRRLRALDYIWKSGVGFTLFYFTNLFVEILGRKGSGTMIFIVSWCYGGLVMVIFILFWQGSYPPWWHHTGIVGLGDPWIDSHRFSLLETLKWFGVWSKMSKVLIVFWDNQCHQIRLIVWSNMIFLTTSAATVGSSICGVAELSPSCGSAWKQ